MYPAETIISPKEFDFIEFEGNFEVYDFNVNHGRLLLRSTNFTYIDDGSTIHENIDIIFFGVTSLWSVFRFNSKFWIRGGSKKEIMQYNQLLTNKRIILGKNLRRDFFVIGDQSSKSHFIGASYFKYYKNNLSYRQTDLEYINEDNFFETQDKLLNEILKNSNK